MTIPTVRWARLWPGLFGLLTTIVVLKASGVGFRAQGLYLVAVLWAVLLPGLLVHRAIAGRPNLLVADLTYGLTVGLLLQLVAWAVFTSLGLGEIQGVWPLLVVVPFIAVPSLRKHWTIAPYARVMHPIAAGVAVVAGVGPLLGAMWGAFRQNRISWDWADWYPDMNWYLGATAELMRAVPPDVAQVAGNTFLYHWFSQATMAAMTHTSGVDMAIVVGRLWLPVAIWALVGMAVALGAHLSGRTWTGAVAALFITLQVCVVMAGWLPPFGYETMTFQSPSQLYTLPFMLFAVQHMVDLVRGERLGLRWIAFALTLLGCAGGKSSTLPALWCAGLLALVIVVVARKLRRTVPGGGSVKGALLAQVALTIAQLVGLIFAGAGSAGAGMKLLGIVGVSAGWRLQYGPEPIQHYSEPFLHLPEPGAAWFAAAVVGLTLVAGGFVALGIPVLRARIEAWILFGVGFAGLCGMFILHQDGYSQAYFMRGAVPAWHLLAAWGLTEIWANGSRRLGWAKVVGLSLVGVNCGLLLGWVVTLLQPVKPEQGQAYGALLALAGVGLMLVAVLAAFHWLRAPGALVLVGSLLAGVAVRHPAYATLRNFDPNVATNYRAWVVVLSALAVGMAVVLWKRWPDRIVGWCAAAATAVVIAGLLMSALASYAPVAKPPAGAQSAAEIKAARWLRDNSGDFDLVATNVHCYRNKTKPCDSRAFWVSGLSQRRMLVESWAYTVEAHKVHGVDGANSRTAPFHDAELFALNEAAFYDPTPEVLNALRSRGVSWLFADDNAGKVSPKLDSLAELVHSNGPVKIYRLA